MAILAPELLAALLAGRADWLQPRDQVLANGRFSPQLFFGPMVGPWLEWRVASGTSIGIDDRLGFIGDAYSMYGEQTGGCDSHFGYRLQFVIGLCL